MAWKYTVNIKKYLDERTDRDAIKQSYDGITKELDSLPAGVRARIPARWNDLAKLSIEREDVELFNLGLDHLYNWADEQRVWMG